MRHLSSRLATFNAAKELPAKTQKQLTGGTGGTGGGNNNSEGSDEVGHKPPPNN